MQLTYRQAEPSELPVILDLLRDAAVWLRERGIDYSRDWLDPSPDYLRWVRDGLQAGEFSFVESLEGDTLGCFRLQWSDELFWRAAREPAGYVHSLTILRRLAGRGLGRAVLGDIEARCLANGRQLLRLDCGTSMAGLRRYYESCGFVAVGEVEFVDGQSHTLYEKPLAEGFG